MAGWLVALAILHGCDAVSTVNVLQHGGQELNPILSQNLVRNVGLQASFTAAQIVALRSLHSRHPKWAKGFAIVAISVEGAIVVHNTVRR